MKDYVAQSNKKGHVKPQDLIRTLHRRYTLEQFYGRADWGSPKLL